MNLRVQLYHLLPKPAGRMPYVTRTIGQRYL